MSCTASTRRGGTTSGCRLHGSSRRPPDKPPVFGARHSSPLLRELGGCSTSSGRPSALGDEGSRCHLHHGTPAHRSQEGDPGLPPGSRRSALNRTADSRIPPAVSEESTPGVTEGAGRGRTSPTARARRASLAGLACAARAGNETPRVGGPAWDARPPSTATKPLEGVRSTDSAEEFDDGDAQPPGNANAAATIRGSRRMDVFRWSAAWSCTRPPA